MTDKVMVLMVRFTGMRAMSVTLVCTGREIRTAGDPTLEAVITNGCVAAARPKASGAMMVPTTE